MHPEKILLITTGGTIAMRRDEAKHGDVPALDGPTLAAQVPGLAAVADIEVLEFGNLPSSSMTPDEMLRLALLAEKNLARPNVRGAVITHGTDTLEETAFFLDRFLATDKPVCLTGAMRTGTHAAPDGPYNMLCAARVATCPAARGHGVLAVMNGEIHAAARVTKGHVSNPAAFVSPCWGPLGYVDDDAVFLRAPVTRPAPLRPEKPARVPLVTMYTGMDLELLDAVAALRPDGLVIEGFGRGNVPAHTAPRVRKLLEQGVTVAVASRVAGGRVLGVYADEGGGASLEAMGVVLAGSLSAAKARLLLMLALGAGLGGAQLAELFTDREKVS